MDDKFEELMHTIFLDYTKEDWLKIVKLIKKRIRVSERDVNEFRESLEKEGLTEQSIERECIWRMWLRGLLPREEARKRIIELDSLHTKSTSSQ